MQVQLWAPHQDVAWLVAALEAAHVQVNCLANADDVIAHQPLLLAYAEPLASLDAEPSALRRILSSLPSLLAGGAPCRLVNLSCLSIPGLVAWCVDPAAPSSPEALPRFPEPEPFDAVLAIKWLEAHPDHLQAYQVLEAHPLAAALDQRPPDLHCLERYRQATRLAALMQVRQERAALETDLRELAAQLEPLQSQQLAALALREQLGLLQARLQQADALQEHCLDLHLSVQAQQLDLEQLSRRLVILEELVCTGSDASLRLQRRLVQALAGTSTI